MTSKSPSVETVFSEALERVRPEERAAYLDRACGGDRQLREQVEGLLEAHDRAEGFLESPAVPPTLDMGCACHAAARPGDTIGPYRLLEVIGEGGMGVVFRAEQSEPVRRTVALKVIKPGMDSRAIIARFEAERQALALMDHPNIARVLDAGTTELGHPYFVMELVRGLPITDYCDRERLSIPDRLDLFVLVCRAVQHAHQKGIIHRDIKPSNVLVTEVDGVAVPKVIDFGVAKALGEASITQTLQTAFHQVVGTPLYMSPEQAGLSSADIDTRSDIYSLGVLLYEMLTGTTPFDAEALRQAAFDEMRRMVREQEAPRPSARLSSLGDRLTTVTANRRVEPRRLNRLMRGEIDWIVMKALEKDRRRRYGTASDLAADVMRFLSGRPVEARPPSTWYRLRKVAIRHRLAILSVSAVALALVAGSVVSVWQAKRAIDAQKRMRTERDHALQAEATARREADKSTAMLEFLTKDLLSQAEPEKNAAEDHMTLLEVLDRSAVRVGRRFTGSPELEIKMRESIASAYHGLASWEKAEGQCRAIQQLARRPGAAPIESDHANWHLAHMLWHRHGPTEEVLKLSREAVEGMTRRLGPDHRETLNCRDNLATITSDAGRVQEAIAMLEETLKRKEKALGPRDSDTLDTREILGSLYLQIGRKDAALPLLDSTAGTGDATGTTREARELKVSKKRASALLREGRHAEAIQLLEPLVPEFVARFGASHDLTLECQEALAMAYTRDGRHQDQAIALMKSVVDQRDAKGAPDDVDTLRSRNFLAITYMAAGRPAEAITVSEGALRRMVSTLGSDQSETLSCRNNLAAAYGQVGRFQEAIALHQENLELKRRKLGPDHRQTLREQSNLAYDCFQAGRWAEAEDLKADAIRRLRAIGSSSTEDLSSGLLMLGLYRNRLRKWPEAEAALRESLAICQSEFPQDLGKFTVMSMLGEAVQNQGRFEEAEPLIVQGYEGLSSRRAELIGFAKDRLSEAAQRVVALYAAWGKPEQAAEWRNRLGLAPPDLPANVFAREEPARP